MIYLDNAATTLKKPPEVIEAAVRAMTAFGNCGRGAHDASLDASRAVYEARESLSDFFHGWGAAQTVFTANSTASLNITLKGLLRPGDHVITTELEHNSVLRPLYELEARGAELSFLQSDRQGRIDLRQLPLLLKKSTRALVCTHASNVTGNVIDLSAAGAFALERGLLFIVDASQTAGFLPLDVQKDFIDVLCFTGHKSLMGIQGAGGIIVNPAVSIRPLFSGGSGIQSFLKTHPAEMPAALEAGTLNGPGIAALKAAVGFIRRVGMEAIFQHEMSLSRRFCAAVRSIPGVQCFGDMDAPLRCPVVSLNIGDVSSGEISDILASSYGIATRPGAHCAPLMHRALGTERQGTVRFSFSWYNTEEEADRAAEAVARIAEEL